jgi:transcriptional regulator with XRE-family HTH domain
MSLARELHAARMDRGLSLRDLGAVCGLSASEVSRIERALIPASVVRLAQLAAVVGLDLSIRAFPGGSPMRDAAQLALLAQFKAQLHRTWKIATEVPLPLPRDQRAWDALVWLPTCRYGVEVESGPRDAQALLRRLQLKRRDGGVDGVLLILPRTDRVRELIRSGALLDALFPVPGGRALELIAAGVDPGGGSVIVLPSRRS